MKILLPLLLLFTCPLAFAFAEIQQPVLFATGVPHSPTADVLIYVDAGWGEGQTSASTSSDSKRIGITWFPASRWTVMANAALNNYPFSKTGFGSQFEVFYAIQNKPTRFLQIGGGLRREKDTNVALLHAIASWNKARSLIQTSLVLEKAASPDRDAVDLISSFGWLRRISSRISVGFETVGQDLEGFWEKNEAEGGARILIGPAFHVSMGEWETGVAGGYVFRPTYNITLRGADRAFGASRYALQFSLSRAL